MSSPLLIPNCDIPVDTPVIPGHEVLVSLQRPYEGEPL